MIRKIVGAKDPILRRKSKPVAKVDKKIVNLAKDLVDTLRAQKDPEGVGLAACQIGKPLCLFAMVQAKKIRVIINPKILKMAKKPSFAKASEGKKQILEGCLSIPYFYGPLKRPQALTLEYLDLEGKKQTEIFTGFPAQIIQHEIDHLSGKLFTDKLIQQKQPLYQHDPSNDEFEEIELT